MPTEGKLRKVALLAALDISLARRKKSPERCARNLMELGMAAYPDKLSNQDRIVFYQKILTACRKGDSSAVRACFVEAFLS